MVDYTRSLLMEMQSFTCTNALHRVWASLKLVLTQSGARIWRMASDTPLIQKCDAASVSHTYVHQTCVRDPGVFLSRLPFVLALLAISSSALDPKPFHGHLL